MRRLFHLLLISVFATFIYLPPLISVLVEDKEVSRAEKRTLATFPEVEFTLAGLARFPREFEEYYEDHFGLREQLITLYNRLYFKILGKSPLPTVTVGRDDWLFYNAEGVLEDYLGLALEPLETYEHWKRILEDREEWLADQGIAYLFVVAPSKVMVYPEKLPERIRRRAGDTLLDRFSSYLAGSGFQGFVDLRPPLLRTKEEKQVYYRTDTHWNPEGAYVAYRTIMERVKERFPGLDLLPESSLQREEVSRWGDICITLNLTEILPEDTVDMAVQDPCGAERYERVAADRVRTGGQKINPNYLPVQNGCPGRPLKVLIIHDSFGLMLRPFFNETFGEVIYSNYMDLQDLHGLIRRQQPDLVMDIRVARHLPGMLERDPVIERDILQKHWPRSSDVRLSIKGAGDREKLAAVNDLRVGGTGDDLRLTATGIDPFLEVRFDNRPAGGPFMLRLALTSPGETEMQVFYAANESEGYSAGSSVDRPLAEGYNEVLIRLPHPEPAGKIRLDPGRLKGEYVLHSLVIKQEKGK